MTMNEENGWSAYLDGELSTSEAAQFEGSLTERGYRRLEAEMKLEAGIADALGTGAACPEPVWDRTRELLKTKMKTTPDPSTSWSRRITALAASLLVCAGAALAYYQLTATPSFLVVPANARELAARNEWEPVWDKAEAYLHHHDVQLALRPLDPGKIDAHGSLEFLGAAHVDYHGEQVVELLFDCCRKPVVLAIAQKDTHVASMIADSVRKGDVQGTQIVGDYLVAVVGKHRPGGLMNVVAEI